MLLDCPWLDVDARDSSNQTPLSIAAENGHTSIVKMLLDLTPNRVDALADNDFRQTPLSIAAEFGHIDIVNMLLDLGTDLVDVNAKDYYSGGTPLYLAPKKGHDAIVKLLLDLGSNRVDINAKDDDGRTPASWAALQGYNSIVEMLDAAQAGTDAIDTI